VQTTYVLTRNFDYLGVPFNIPYITNFQFCQQFNSQNHSKSSEVIAVTVLPKYSFIHFICLITEQAKCSGSAVCNRHNLKTFKHTWQHTTGNKCHEHQDSDHQHRDQDQETSLQGQDSKNTILRLSQDQTISTEYILQTLLSRDIGNTYRPLGI